MSCRKMIRWVVVAVLFLLVAVDASLALDNLRVAYPSLNTSVFALIIAEKEGYMKEEGLNVELLSIRGEIAIRTTLAGDVDFFTNAGKRWRRRFGGFRSSSSLSFKTSPAGI
ncbi:MAG: hypothetical protein U1E51_19135 [Candidatus Binatia bacterium]|nr:hypothetical protein [Candidatus Binatia bacterium]